MKILEIIESAAVMAGGTLLILVAGALAARDSHAADATLRNFQILDTAHESFVTAIAVNTSGETLEHPEIVIDVDGPRIIHIGPAHIEPGGAWRIKERIPGSTGFKQKPRQ